MHLIKRISIVFVALLLSSCGDFPDYRYDRSDDYCVISFPFAGGIFDRKYVGYFNLTSTLQFLDSDPELGIFIGEPSHIELETGSVQKIEINDQTFIPEFNKNFLHPELQYWGPAFTFNAQQSQKIYAALQEGYDITIHGRLEIGVQYETEIYNFFFEDDDEPFRACVNRLLSEKDLENLAKEKAAAK